MDSTGDVKFARNKDRIQIRTYICFVFLSFSGEKSAENCPLPFTDAGKALPPASPPSTLLVIFSLRWLSRRTVFQRPLHSSFSHRAPGFCTSSWRLSRRPKPLPASRGVTATEARCRCWCDEWEVQGWCCITFTVTSFFCFALFFVFFGGFD